MVMIAHNGMMGLHLMEENKDSHIIGTYHFRWL